MNTSSVVLPDLKTRNLAEINFAKGFSPLEIEIYYLLVQNLTDDMKDNNVEGKIEVQELLSKFNSQDELEETILRLMKTILCFRSLDEKFEFRVQLLGGNETTYNENTKKYVGAFKYSIDKQLIEYIRHQPLLVDLNDTIKVISN